MVRSRRPNLDLKDCVELQRAPERGLEALHVSNRFVEPEGLGRHERNPGIVSQSNHCSGIVGCCSQRLLDQQRFAGLHRESADLQ